MAAARSVTLADVLQYHSTLLQRVYPTALVHGNAAESTATEAFAAVTSALMSAGVSPMLPPPSTAAATSTSGSSSSSSSDTEVFPMVRVGWLPQGQRVRVRAKAQSASEANSALVSYFQVSFGNLNSSFKYNILACRRACKFELESASHLHADQAQLCNWL
jgi:secreted Zn-dependent insulinase-like peptidase